MRPNPRPALGGLTEAQRQAAAKRFYAKIEIDPETQCHNWTGAKASDGYGQFAVRGPEDVRRAHRVAWELERGAIPAGLLLRHVICDNRGCCNTGHMQAGTQAQNMRDMTSARRGRTKLTDADVTTIIGLSILGWEPKELAEEFGTSPNYVRLILNGQRRQEASDAELEAQNA